MFTDGEIQHFKMSTSPKLIYRNNVFPIKTQHFYFVEIKKLIIKFIWRCRGPKEPRQSLRRTKLRDIL